MASPLDAPLLAMKQVFRGPFLKSPANFSGTKSNFQIEIKRIRVLVLANKLLHFFSLTDSFIKLDAKLLETSILHVNNDSFMGPLIITTFKKQAPEPNVSCYF